MPLPGNNLRDNLFMTPRPVMQFEMTHNIFEGKVVKFSELNPPNWLTGDTGWFWRKHVLTLAVGEAVVTDFQTIKRAQ